MEMIESLVTDGSVAWLAIAVLGLELVLLTVLARKGRSLVPFVANALSGLFLILALRAALVGSAAMTIAALLGLGFLAHIIELVMRLRSRP
jgi:hypothetical protein